MKTYEEMAQSALTRGNAMRKKRVRNKRIILGAASGLAACCLVILWFFGIERNGFFSVSMNDPLDNGPIKFLSTSCKTDVDISGESFQYIAGMNPPNVGPQPNVPVPEFRFEYGYLHVVAKAVEDLGIYITLNEYGSTQTDEYRLFRMEVIDSLQSGMVGEFYYLLPKRLQGDLTQYDALLISMKQLPLNFVLRKGNQLTAFEYLFIDPYGEPELGNIIAFTDGIFDESLWQDESWIEGYRYARYRLDRKNNDLLVYRGSTLKKALQRRKIQIYLWGQWTKIATVKHYDFQSEAAQQAMAYLKPFENGVFVPVRNSQNYYIRRYINGCPTNEWISIDSENEAVTYSDYRFEDGDFENLPDISAYIQSLDLSQITPQHMDLEGKILMYKSAVGWYEKTETGVYAIVRIAWSYFEEGDFYTAYYDETFILLDETGDHIISREDLIDLIGYNRNISDNVYGVGIPLPMA